MTLRSLLVVLDQGELDTQRTEAAIRLAREWDCHLVGLAATGLVDLPASPAGSGPLAEFAALARDDLREHAESATQTFRDRCRAAGLASFEAVVDEDERARSVLRHAHCSDLVMLTQADPVASDGSATRQMVEQVVLGSARPVLLLPHGGWSGPIGTRAMVAWDDGPQAARAVADALPLLARADSVTVVSWHGPHVGAGDATRARLEPLAQWLAWHGVSAEVRVEAGGGPVADAILARAGAVGADLLVMGAYGHSRWSERLLGGATLGVLRSMAVPVLMSH